MKLLQHFWASRFWSLVQKEIRQILRNRHLIIILIVPPTIQLLVYGFALNPDVHHLPLGIVDYSHTTESRELVSALTENKTFIADRFLLDEDQLARDVETGHLTAGLVIPPKFHEDIEQDRPTEVQVFVDGVDANTAGITSGYINQMIQQYVLKRNHITLPIETDVIFLYNPGLASSWFFVPGVMGLVLTLIGSIVSAVTLVREKDTGTLEQLLMTPAEAWEILLSKIVPIFMLLLGDVLLALTIGRTVFGIPFNGNFLLFLVLSGLYLFVGIGVGTLLATVCQSQQQVVLTTFFINLPMVQLSGAIAPIETMPTFFRYLSLLNPLRHYIAILRGIMLKGVGLEALWMHVLALATFAIVLISVSSYYFRKQLS